MISIIIVDDQRLLREGLQTLLQTEEGLLSVLSEGKSNRFDEVKLRERGYSFTVRERKIIELMIEGYTNRQISSSLFIERDRLEPYQRHLQ